MKSNYFISLENLPDKTQLELPHLLEQLVFNEAGLIPVIAQDYLSKEVLMLAWMSKESLQQTLATGKMTYWSRSRQALWVKGATSGNHQILYSMSFDCDGDAILCLVNQQGGACHTGRNSCFYLMVDNHKQQVTINS